MKRVQWHPTRDILFSCNYDNNVKVWADEGDGDDWQCVQTLGEPNNGHTSTVWAFSFNARGDKIVTCSDDLTMKIWEVDNIGMQFSDGFAPWRHLCTLTGYHDRTIFSVHWSRDGIIASGAADDAIRFFVENNESSVSTSLSFFLFLLWNVDFFGAISNGSSSFKCIKFGSS